MTADRPATQHSAKDTENGCDNMVLDRDETLRGSEATFDMGAHTTVSSSSTSASTSNNFHEKQTQTEKDITNPTATDSFKGNGNGNGNGPYVIPMLDNYRRIVQHTENSNKEKQNNQNGTHKNQNVSEKSYIDYEPYQHIQRKNPTSYWDTIFHLLKANLGTGILAMPNAFHNAGYAVGLVGTLTIAFICTYNIHILIASEYELCRRKKVPSMTYPETAQAAFEEGPTRLKRFASYGRFFTNFSLLTYQIGTSSIYTVFIASNLKDVYDTYNGTNISVRLVTLYLLAPMILITWVRNLKLLVPFSTVANAATILSFVLIFRFIFDGFPSFAGREAVGTIRGMPLFFGTVLFAMEAIGVIMPLKNQMKKPKKFGSLFGVLNISMLPISLLYTLIGFFGYLKYGDETAGSVTLNLPSDNLLAQAVKLLYSASIFITYALSNYVVFDIIWNNGIKSMITSSSSTSRVLWEYAVRTGIACFSFFLAIAIPNLEIFISFVGAFSLSSIGIAFPAIIQILVFWNHHDDSFQFSMMVFRNLIIVIIAVLAFTIGVSTSVIKFFNEMT